MILRNVCVYLSALIVFCLVSVSCATMKHVREAIAPVQKQANQTQDHVNALQKQVDANRQAIGELDREVATASEKATDASKKAAEAAEAAARAHAAAAEAARRADEANSLSRQVQQEVAVLNRSLQNLSNYKLVATEQVFFGVNRSTPSKAECVKLDSVIEKLGDMKNYIVEVEGFADSTGDKVHNLELGRKRADGVVHYLAVERKVSVLSIRQLGVGSEFPGADNRTRDARKGNRRVDVKIYALDLGAQSLRSPRNAQ